jgi:hypothetical protein
MNVNQRSERSPVERIGVIDTPDVTHLVYRIKKEV